MSEKKNHQQKIDSEFKMVVSFRIAVSSIEIRKKKIHYNISYMGNEVGNPQTGKENLTKAGS